MLGVCVFSGGRVCGCPPFLNAPITLQRWLPSHVIIHFLRGGIQNTGFRNGNYSRAFKSLYKSAPNSPAALLSPTVGNNIRATDMALRTREAARKRSRGKADRCSKWNKNQIHCCAFHFQVTGLSQDPCFCLITWMVFYGSRTFIEVF